VLDCLLPTTVQYITLLEYSARQEVDVYLLWPLDRFWPLIGRVLTAQNRSYRLLTKDPKADSITYNETFTSFKPGSGARVHCKQCLRDLAYQYAEVPPATQPVTCAHTLYMVRTSRGLRNYRSLMGHLKRVGAPYGVPVIPFYGNESVLDTITLFSNACAVFGTHGAGHTNAIFCRKDALVVEINTYIAPESHTDVDAAPISWRSNEGAIVTGLDFHMKWIKYHVEYSNMRPVPKEEHYKPHGRIDALETDWSHYIKGMDMVLDRQNLHNLAALLEAHLADIFPHVKPFDRHKR
jgi:hypothetical protein